MTRYLKFSTLIVAVVALVGADLGAQEAPEPIALVRAVEVDAAELDLSDLLPVSAPDSARELARTVGLGRTPQLGYQRTLTRRFIENQLLGIAGLNGVLQVPANVVVRRKGYPIDISDVLAPLEAALESAGCGDLLPLDPGALILPATVAYTEPEPSLEVLGVDLDSLRSEIQVRMRAAGSGPRVPFFVSVVGTGNTAGEGRSRSSCAMSRPGVLASRPEGNGTPIHPAGPILARAGEIATLQAVGRGLKLFMTVVPLENGRAGDWVRVRNTDTEGIVTAKVIGPDLLERGF